MDGTGIDDTIFLTAAADIVDPHDGNDLVYGFGGWDVFFASEGDDVLYGRTRPGESPGLDYEIDTLVFASARADVTIEPHNFILFHNPSHHIAPTVYAGWKLTAPAEAEGVETVLDVDRFVFAGGQATAVDIGWFGFYPWEERTAGQAAKLVGALFGAPALENEFLVGIVLAGLDAGLGEEYVAALSLEYQGADTPEEIVRLIWDNVVAEPIVESYLQEYVGLIEGGMSGAQFAVQASDHYYNTDRIGLTGYTPGIMLRETGLDYEYYPV
jgi:hypothetical protein